LLKKGHANRLPFSFPSSRAPLRFFNLESQGALMKTAYSPFVPAEKPIGSGSVTEGTQQFEILKFKLSFLQNTSSDAS
jgi:hypothetical protein